MAQPAKKNDVSQKPASGLGQNGSKENIIEIKITQKAEKQKKEPKPPGKIINLADYRRQLEQIKMQAGRQKKIDGRQNQPTEQSQGEKQTAPLPMTNIPNEAKLARQYAQGAPMSGGSQGSTFSGGSANQIQNNAQAAPQQPGQADIESENQTTEPQNQNDGGPMPDNAEAATDQSEQTKDESKNSADAGQDFTEKEMAEQQDQATKQQNQAEEKQEEEKPNQESEQASPEPDQESEPQGKESDQQKSRKLEQGKKKDRRKEGIKQKIKSRINQAKKESQNATARLLRQAWLNLISTWFLSYFYIAFHFLVRYFVAGVGDLFCRFGQEWFPAKPMGTGSTMNPDDGDKENEENDETAANQGCEFISIIGCFLVGLFVLTLIFVIYITIAFFVYVLTHNLEFLSNFPGMAWETIKCFAGHAIGIGECASGATNGG
jgi:hypothetical protein